MLTFFAMTLRSFMALALIAGFTGGLWSRARPYRWRKELLWGIGGGLIFGVALIVCQEFGLLPLAVVIILNTAVILTSLAALAVSWNPRHGAHRILLGVACTFPSLTAATAMLQFGMFVASHSVVEAAVLSSTTIINTAGVLFGLITVLLVGLVTTYFTSCMSRALNWVALLLTALVLDLIIGANVALGLMRLQWLEVTRGVLSGVAKVTHATPFFDYVWAGILFWVVVGGLWIHGARASKKNAPAVGVEHRRIRAKQLLHCRWIFAAVLTLSMVAGIPLYHNLVLTRPLRLSTPQLLRVNSQDELRIAISQVQDGSLHRFAYLTHKGRMVRFFLINRAQDEGKPDIGTVFDACVLCGDQGYLQEDRNVICRACEGRIFVPTIGQAGGCNPIPLPHKIIDGKVVISRSALTDQERVFITNEKAATEDPVTGASLTTDQALISWRYRENTYYFATQSNYDQFKEAPEDYLAARAPDLD